VLQAENLTKYYGEHLALDSLNLSLSEGEIFCLLGPNGTGKTTTIHLFLNFIQPSKGRALVAGKCVGEHPLEARRNMAYIPEQVAFYGMLTGLENLAYFCQLAGKHFTQAEKLQFLARVGLPERAAKAQVRTYSKGMRQKVAVAIALARDAKAMVLDEPTSGLDPQASNALSATLLELKSAGVTVLMATHDVFRARETGDRVGIMRQGKLEHVMATNQITAQELEAAYLRCVQDVGTAV